VEMCGMTSCKGSHVLITARKWRWCWALYSVQAVVMCALEPDKWAFRSEYVLCSVLYHRSKLESSSYISAVVGMKRYYEQTHRLHTQIVRVS